MRRLLTKASALVFGASAMALMAASPARADSPWYAGLAGGYGEPTGDATVRFTLDGETGSGDLNGEGGGVGSLTLGRRIGRGFRAELDVGFRTSDFSDPAELAGVDGSIEQISALVNLIRDFNRDGRVQPYLGAGVGYVQNDVEVNGLGPSPTQDEDGGLAAQGLAGLGVNLSERVTLDLGYRFFWSDDMEVGDDAGLSGAIEDFARHDGLIGLRFNWGGRRAAPPPPAPPPARVEAPPPPPPPVAPPAPPAPNCPSAETTVYFPFDSTAITAEAEAALRAIASGRGVGCAHRFRVTGHTDRSGSNAYNDNLARSRAGVVQARLISLGVPPGEIVVSGLGEDQPAAATPDGVREPRNRRVEIVRSSSPAASTARLTSQPSATGALSPPTTADDGELAGGPDAPRPGAN